MGPEIAISAPKIAISASGPARVGRTVGVERVAGVAGVAGSAGAEVRRVGIEAEAGVAEKVAEAVAVVVKGGMAVSWAMGGDTAGVMEGN